MKLIIDKSPNFSRTKRANKNVKFVIIHYTGMQSEIESLKRLKNPKSKVSCHYLINRSGFIIQMVKDSFVAWHAGKSCWKNHKNLNIGDLFYAIPYHICPTVAKYNKSYVVINGEIQSLWDIQARDYQLSI